MNISKIMRTFQKNASDNSPTILIAIGVAGVAATAVLAGKASFKAAEVIRVGNEAAYYPDEEVEPLTLGEMARSTWKLYIPAAVTGIATVACILSANRINASRAAVMASAFSLSQDALGRYTEKVREKFGEAKEQEIRDALAQDIVSRTNIPSVIVFGSGDVLCMDIWSGRAFMSTLQKLKEAEVNTNYEIIRQDYASLTDYWDRIGLPKTSDSDNIGWSSDAKLEVKYASAIAEDGRPCITIDFDGTIPVRGYWSTNR